MHAVVVGCGRVGSELAGRLASDGHTVAVIDKRGEAFRRLPEGFSGKTIQGFGFDRDDLQEAGIRDAQALAAVTNGDNSNVLTARIARETFSVPNVVARIYDPRRAVIYGRLGISTVATVSWTTGQVWRRLFPEETDRVWTDTTGQLTLLERQLPKEWAGSKLDRLSEDEAQFRLVAVTRDGSIRLARSGVVGQEGDTLHMLVREEVMPQLDALLAGGPEGH